MKAIRNSFLFCVVVLLLFTSCNSTEEISEQIPVVTTGTISKVTSTSATCQGSINYKGTDAIIARGVCWETIPYPTIKSSFTTDSTGTGNFVSSLTDLQPATTYYVRAYATTVNGTWYGNVFHITTETDDTHPNPVLNPNLTYGAMTDIEGNVYHTITIGAQTWMVENLIVTKYRNGESIPYVTNNANWNVLTSGAQCTYNNNLEINSIKKFGRLYSRALKSA